MSPRLSNRNRQLLSRSLPVVQARKHEVIDQIQANLMLGELDQPHGQSEINAMILVALLLNQVNHVLETGEWDDLDHIQDEHSALNITGRTYSRFGDVLAPILRDVLGADAPSEVGGAWTDMFWEVIRQSRSRQRLREAA